ncbi:MAG: hypothetical protein U9N87_14725 [Planctomycetota bacterium]|nr:hypothetical protein [Planctomycetota bacterium]
MTDDKHDQTALQPWMRPLLIFAGIFNVLAGSCMIVFYHEGYKLLGIPRPEVVLPVQVMGILVALFGVGYLLVAKNPLENRHILALGFWSKALSSALAIAYVFNGELPLVLLPIVIFSDVIYLPPFYMILRIIYRQADQAQHN